MEIQLLAGLIVIFGSVNLLRMAMFLIGSDIYGLKAHKRLKNRKTYFPSVSVIIPAYNEEGNIVPCIKSVVNSDYPIGKVEIIVIDDGSSDHTSLEVKKYKHQNPRSNLKLVRQNNAGKASALNNGIINYAHSDIIMCLDSDSYLGKSAIKNAVQYFLDPKVAALSSNIKILKGPGILNLIQCYEYLIAYQMKRAESLFNIEYIVGGIGSVFRKSVLEKVGYYDTNTVTEDIDLTMKILQLGNKEFKVVYGADVMTYTESVISIPGLIKQRFRWKWGRCQTFLKNKNMFFSTNNKFTRGLTLFYLPLALYGEVTYIIEPILLAYILGISVYYHDPVPLISAWLILTNYVIINILAEDSITIKEKVGFLIGAPMMYLLFYVLSFVEYTALVKTLLKIHKLRLSLGYSNQSWNHVERQTQIDRLRLTQ